MGSGETAANMATERAVTLSRNAVMFRAQAMVLWIFPGDSQERAPPLLPPGIILVWTNCQRHTLGLVKVDGSVLAEVVTGKHGDLWTQGLVIAYGRAAEAFSHEFGEGGLWFPVNGKLPEQLPEWAGDHGIRD